MKNKRCLQCGKEIYSKVVRKYKNKTYVYNYPGKKFCSLKCYHLYAKGRPLTGKALESAQKTIKKACEIRKNNPEIRERWLRKMKEIRLGKNNGRWINDRSKLVNQDERNSYNYREWRNSVFVRDNYKCRINNSDCCGKLEVHHILSWRDYPELHYVINNGITLCHFHHPRVRKEEKRLIPTFRELVSVSNRLTCYKTHIAKK